MKKWFARYSVIGVVLMILGACIPDKHQVLEVNVCVHDLDERSRLAGALKQYGARNRMDIRDISRQSQADHEYNLRQMNLPIPRVEELLFTMTSRDGSVFVVVTAQDRFELKPQISVWASDRKAGEAQASKLVAELRKDAWYIRPIDPQGLPTCPAK
jgi:hypothetical protein